MFWKTNVAVQKTSTMAEPIVIERPKPRLVVNNKSLGSEYEQLEKAIGLNSAAIVEAKILKTIVANKIPTYDLASVNEYLIDIAVSKGKIWIWRPLRKRDKPGDWHWGNLNSHGSYMDTWKFRPYDKAVPLRILRHVKIIQDAVPEALFFVSDYAVSNPDPFIMVTALDVSKIVFGFWDEPGFVG